MDLVNITTSSSKADVDAARAVCRACPIAAACAQYVKRTHVAGVAAGLTEDQRVKWQQDHGVRVDDDGDAMWAAYVVNVTPARQITKAMVDDIPLRTTSGELHPFALGLIERMNKAGMTREQITDLLDLDQAATDTTSVLLGRAPEGVTGRTVNYTRRLRKEHVRVDA